MSDREPVTTGPAAEAARDQYATSERRLVTIIDRYRRRCQWRDMYDEEGRLAILRRCAPQELVR